MKRLAGLVAVALATIAVVVLLWRFRDAALLFLFSLLVAAAARPPIDYLVQRGWPRGLATAAVYLLSLGILGGLLFLGGGPLIREMQTAGDAVARIYERLQTQPPDNDLLAALTGRLPKLSEVYAMLSGAGAASIVGNALGVTLSFFDLLSKVVIVLVLSIYWGVDQVHFERLWLSLLPAEHRERARNIWRAIEVGVGAYLRSEIIQSVLAGIALGLGLWAIGMPAPVLLALIGAIAWLVPMVGGVLALVPVALVGALVSPWLSVGGVVLTLAVFIGLEVVVERRLYDPSRYSPILVLLLMIALAGVMGILGLVIAPPLAAAVQIFFRQLVQPAPVSSPERVQSKMGELRERLQAARALAEREGEETPPELTSLVQRLERLVDEAGDALHEEVPTQPRGRRVLLPVPPVGPADAGKHA